MLKIWGRATSANVQKVLWLATEIGVPFERIDAGGAFGRTNEPGYRAMNPNGLVPTIDDDGFTLWESNTILRYLAARHRAAAWYPVDLHARADVERWMDWSATVLAPALLPAFLGLVRTPAGQRDPAAIAAAGEKTGAAMSILETQLAGRPYLCGSGPTLADIANGIHLYRWLHLDLAAAGYRRPELPGVRAWFDRLAERAAYRQWVRVPIA